MSSDGEREHVRISDDTTSLAHLSAFLCKSKMLQEARGG